MTTTETKASLSVDVTLVDMRFSAFEEAKTALLYRAEWGTIRAHIAAQAEEIAAFEAKLSDASMDYYNQQQGKERLEAENKRLREALQQILETANAEDSGALHSADWCPELVADMARAALAPAQKPADKCETCGLGEAKELCTICHGTGKN